MREEIERQVISALIDQLDFIETDGLTIQTFSIPKYIEIFKALSEIREDSRGDSANLVLLSEMSRVSVSDIIQIQEGTYPPKPEEFVGWINRLKQRSLVEQVLRLSQYEAESYVKSGEIDDNNVSKLLGLWQEINDLQYFRSGLQCTRLNQIEGRAVEWLWRNRIPLGMISLIVGDPGLGKSFLAVWICSKLSVGASLPEDPGPPLEGSTVYLSAEDSPIYALQPRASRNGADLSRIILPGDLSFNISSDLPKIRSIVREDSSVRLLIIDPLNSYLGKTDYLNDPDVRKKLNPLIEFCEETKIACLAVMHLNKKTDLSAIYRIGGSIAFAGVARSIMAVTQNPNDEERRLLGSIKMNYAKKPDTLAFRIGEDLSLNFDKGPVDADIIESLSPPSGKETKKGSFVVEWLRDLLEEGPREYQEISSLAETDKISRSALQRAKIKLGISSKPSGFGIGRQTYWQLPDDTYRRECNEIYGTDGTDEIDERGESPISPIGPISSTFTQSGIVGGRNVNSSCPELSGQPNKEKDS